MWVFEPRKLAPLCPCSTVVVRLSCKQLTGVRFLAGAPSPWYNRTMGYQGDEKRAYQLQWMEARRSEWIMANGPCVHCGSEENLEVDHIIPRKIAGGLAPSAIWSRREEVRTRELAKCQVLCSTCHAEKSRSESFQGNHGARAMYERHGCRCEPCKAWKKQKNARRYASVV